MDKRKVRSLVPCCGQDGYRAQVLHTPKIHTDTYHPYITYHVDRQLYILLLCQIGRLEIELKYFRLNQLKENLMIIG